MNRKPQCNSLSKERLGLCPNMVAWSRQIVLAKLIVASSCIIATACYLPDNEEASGLFYQPEFLSLNSEKITCRKKQENSEFSEWYISYV